MERREVAIAAMRTALHRLPTAMLILVLIALCCSVLTLAIRHVQKQQGVGAVDSPAVPTAAYGETPSRSGRFTVPVSYTSLDAPGNGEVSSAVVWDDGWFAQDSTVYNHELATTSSVIAALAYSESGYYQAGRVQPAYMEDALAKFGFQDVSTESYRYRSEVVDEVLNFFTDDSDTVAYAIARKRLASDEVNGGAASGAAPRDLILVSVRGSYGSEWLSNLNLMPRQDGGAGAGFADLRQPLELLFGSWMDFVNVLAHGNSDAGRGVSSASEAVTELGGTGDHAGYYQASEEIYAELTRWIDESRADGAEVSVLLTGHSRGGAIANLLAAELDNDPMRDIGERSRVYAYTFAAPSTTVSANAHDERYANIFNIINPSDIMPYLPLRAWGYERYGVNLYLPGVDQDSFDAAFDEMRESYRRAVGTACAYDPRDKYAVDSALGDVARQVESVHDLMTPAGAAATVASCVSHIDPVRILYGHYPSTYIAWMDVLDADGLARD